jgi:elongation factor 3
MAAQLKTEIEKLVAQIGNKKEAVGALEGLAKVAAEKGTPAEPFLVKAMGAIGEAMGDKDKKTRDAAIAAAEAILKTASPFAFSVLMPTFLAGLGVKAKPPQKEATLNLIAAFAKRAPKSIGFELVSLISPVADLTCDIKKEVKAAALACMEAIAQCTGNKDVEPFLPSVVDAASSITNTHNCVEKLAGCVFVQNVETPALAVMVPVLTRGLNDKSEEVRRTCCQIVDNMCKVVEDPAEVWPLMPKMEPLVKATVEKMSDPEARGMAERAHVTLTKASEGSSDKVTVKAEDAAKVLKVRWGQGHDRGGAGLRGCSRGHGHEHAEF